MTHLALEEYPEGILILDTSTLQIRNGNAKAADLFGIDKEKISEFRLPDLLPEAAPLFSDGKAVSMLHELPGKKRTRVVELSVVPRKNESDSSRPLFIREITSHCELRRELERELERHRLLDRETHHRVKNSLAIISSLIGLKSVDFENAKEFYHLASQVDAVAEIHNELARKPGTLKVNISSYLARVAKNAVQAYGFSQLNLEINVENREIPAKTAQSLGIVVNEIIINTCKYGFYSENPSQAKIWLELSSCPQKEERELLLKIGNNGSFRTGSSELRNSSGIGRTLIDALLQELKASLRVVKEPHPIFTIRLTLQDE